MTQPITLVLPYPISANRYWQTVYVGKGAQKRAIMVPTKEAKAYRDEVTRRAKGSGLAAPLAGRLVLSVALYPDRPQDWAKRAQKDPDTWDDTVRCIDLGNCENIVTPNWLSEMVRVMDTNPQVSQTCPDTNNHYPDPKIWAVVKRLPVIGKYMHKLQLQLGQAPRNPEQSDFIPVDSFTLYPGGYCNLLRSKYFPDLGYLMDPNIIHGYWDDFDLGMYMKQFGQVGGTNKSYVFHFLNTSFNLLSENRRKFKHRLTFLNGMYCMDKWSAEIRRELAAKSPMELIDMSESPVMQAALQYLGLAQDPKFVEFIRSIPAREVWEAK